ncbi:protein transport protein Sec24C [Gadus macrocephalus]|uniref:protein transport protein Sec24C n=1 Tax=Gadus macrocephalus TaxID=80720 RepID=UPI0028CB6CF4|nr:protein transport protein Sec24C [Gadus macrocephalus]
MVNVSTAIQSTMDTTQQPDHNFTPQNLHHDTLPNFQHLTLGSPTHPGLQEASTPPAPQHSYFYQNNIPSPPCHTHWNTHDIAAHCPSSNALHANPTQHMQGLDPCQSLGISPMHSNGSRQSDPTTPQLANQELQLCRPPPASLYPPLHEANRESPAAPCLPPYTDQHVLNGAQPLNQHCVSSSLPLNGLPPNGQRLSHGHHSSSPTAYAHVKRATLPLPLAGSVPLHLSPSSPIQRQPQWTLPARDGGPIYEAVPQEPLHPGSQGLDGSDAAQSPSSESRYGLDPKILPSAVRVMAEDRAEWEGKVYRSGPDSSLPPLATTRCIIEDGGSASPCAIRCTTYRVPCEAQAAQLSRLPLGALLSPIAPLGPGEGALPLCSEQECLKGCGECGASMCPAMSWQDCGQRFYCPFCGKFNDVPWQHYQPTAGVEGVRVDRDQRPELRMGSYEILHPNKGEAAVLLLALDVSPPALRGGHLDYVTQQIRTLLHSLHREHGTPETPPADLRVGLMTYDSRIHLYDLSPALSRPHMLVVTETDDLQLPVRDGLLVSLRDCMDSIDSVLQHIPLFSPDGGETHGVPVELPIRAGLSILQAMSCPGKLLLFHTAPLTEGEDTQFSGFFGSNKPKSIFQPSDPAVSMARECTNQGCGVHLFMLSQQDVGGAWPGNIPYLTGGVLYVYNNLQGELERQCFSTDLRRTMEAQTVYKAQLRIHVSKELRVSGCYGLFNPGDKPSQVALATLDWRTTLAVELAYLRDLDEKRGVAIQVTATYSDAAGQRRSRVHTLVLRCSRHLLDTFRHCQAQTLLSFYCKKTYCAVLERPLQDLRGELQAEVTAALACYRKHCSSACVSTGQLVLPPPLRPLPVYINSLRKSEVLLPGLRSSVHQRLQLRCQVLRMDASSTAAHFYPLLLPLPRCVEDCSDAAGPPDPADGLRCTADSLEQGGLYLVSGPLALLLWVGSHVRPATLVQLFNASCFSSLPSGETKMCSLDNSLSTRVCSLIDTLSSQAPYARKLWVVKQGDGCEEALQRHLVEDKSPNGGASYADFLYHLHINSVKLLQ